MTFERSPGFPGEVAPLDAQPGPDPEDGGTSGGARPPTPAQIRLQILTTEHWSLLASRSLAWNESFARAGMYLSTLSGAMVALGLIAGVDRVGDVFFVFSLVILPVVLFVGLATWIRMGAANWHDATTVVGMNRIRGAYLELAPELEPYFVMGVHDDRAGVEVTMALPPGMPSILHIVAATPFVVLILNGVVGGVITGIIVFRILGQDLLPVFAASATVFGAVVVAQARIAATNIRRGQRALRPMFPTPDQSGIPGASVNPASPRRNDRQP